VYLFDHLTAFLRFVAIFDGIAPLSVTTLPGSPGQPAKRGYYSLLFPAFFALAHRALANAANLALPAAVNFRLGF
jgi:hypothetical protein